MLHISKLRWLAIDKYAIARYDPGQEVSLSYSAKVRIIRPSSPVNLQRTHWSFAPMHSDQVYRLHSPSFPNS